ncbi:MAG: prolyl oligopeptidase family serine peptidase [Gemmatimonadetes bacterium]|nr:prolyl oligopeptidase family serine peptidase [Gemmatimonadota bacterium]
MTHLRTPILLLALTLAGTGSAVAQEGAGYVLPNDEIQRLFATDKNFVQLDHLSPDGNHFLVLHETELSTLERMGEPTLRLAELELRPAVDRIWNHDTYGVDGLRIFSLARLAYRNVEVPQGAFLSDFMWSPAGDRVAYLQHGRDRTEVWVAESATGQTRRVADARVVATLGTSAPTTTPRASDMLQWTPEGTLLTLIAPAGRGAPPAAPHRPTGPVVRTTREEATPNPTYPNLLRTPHDADLFEYHTTTQIAELSANGRVRPIGRPGMYERIVLSPDGRYLLATRIVRPFSFLTSWRGFPRVTEVLDREGTVVATLDEQQLREGSGRTARQGPPARRRGWAWRPEGAALVFLMRAEASDSAAGDDARPEGIHQLLPPFDTAQATLLGTSDASVGDVLFSQGGAHMFAQVTRDGKRGLMHWPLTAEGGPVRHMVIDWWDPQTPMENPGEPWTATTSNGIAYARITSNGRALLVRGPGYADDLRPTPFVDHVALSDGMVNRVFEGSKELYEQPLVTLDPDGSRLIVRREGANQFPDSWLWVLGGRWDNLSKNVDPFPAITAAKRVDFEFERRDGLTMRGRISLPVDYVEGTRVPAIFWTYPREYRTEKAYRAATIESRNLNAFTPLSWLRWSDIWLTQGYALVYPDIPIVGENYNDFYIADMVDDMYAAVRAVEKSGYVDVERIGHGGHSYGAFATANFLAHTPFFKAGIAGDGAYNRSLTPMGFQAEPRDIWEAQDVYLEMSPFFKADQIDTPLLMYHGGDDNNTGTFPIQSERFMQALQGLGKTAELYIYPFESHTPRAIENELDRWARWVGFFDRYVKGDRPADVSEQGGGR